MSESPSTRRDLLKVLQSAAQAARQDTTDPNSLVAGNSHGQNQFESGSTIRVATRAMACEFSVILNPGSAQQLAVAGDALHTIHEIESWLSIYRDDSEISRVNRYAAERSEPIRPSFQKLLQLAKTLHTQTDGAFEIASGSLVQLWKESRRLSTIPTAEQIHAALQASGTQHLLLNEAEGMVRFEVPGMRLDPGAIGKGFALDEVVEDLSQNEHAPKDFLLHGGHSSLIARGEHQGQQGWPVGIGNPLFTRKRLATVLLTNQAMSTSGSNIQFFRHEGHRYGHILDPRNGWPVEGMLSVTVLAPSAAVADAVSTAFFVLGVEKARQCCENIGDIGVILVPFPDQGRRVYPQVIGIPANRILWDEDQVVLP